MHRVGTGAPRVKYYLRIHCHFWIILTADVVCISVYCDYVLDQKKLGMSMKIEKSSVDDVLGRIEMHKNKVLEAKSKTLDVPGVLLYCVMTCRN